MFFALFFIVFQIILTLPFSRKLEKEADEVGMFMAAKVNSFLVFICFFLFTIFRLFFAGTLVIFHPKVFSPRRHPKIGLPRFPSMPDLET